MKRNIALIALASLSVACALLEGLVDTILPRFIQINKLLIIFCTGLCVIRALKVRITGSASKNLEKLKTRVDR
ncbi:MAG: hypothetical protein WBS20_04365 [Lysobacterales bacterium]